MVGRKGGAEGGRREGREEWPRQKPGICGAPLPPLTRLFPHDPRWLGHWAGKCIYSPGRDPERNLLFLIARFADCALHTTTATTSPPLWRYVGGRQLPPCRFPLSMAPPSSPPPAPMTKHYCEENTPEKGITLWQSLHAADTLPCACQKSLCALFFFYHFLKGSLFCFFFSSSSLVTCKRWSIYVCVCVFACIYYHLLD